MRFFIILLVPFFITACSVVAAATGSPEPDFSEINTGTSRVKVETELGEPLETIETPLGTKSIYSYKIGDTPAAGRALGYLALDIVTLCLAEYILFPLEISNSGNAYEATVLYDQNDTVKKLTKKSTPQPESNQEI